MLEAAMVKKFHADPDIDLESLSEVEAAMLELEDIQ